jgi:hypothetical protein
MGDNAYRINLPPYIHIFSVVNVDNLKLYEPSMLDQEEHVLPSIEELAPNAQANLVDNTVLQKQSKLEDRGNMTLGILD